MTVRSPYLKQFYFYCKKCENRLLTNQLTPFTAGLILVKNQISLASLGHTIKSNGL